MRSFNQPILYFIKYILIFLFSSLLYMGCNTAEKALRRGNYDSAFYSSLKKVRKNPGNEKYVSILNESYNKDRESKKERIQFLQKEGVPERWEEIFGLYDELKRKQQSVSSLPPLFLNAGKTKVNFPFTDYDEEIIQAKKNASEYLYSHASGLLKQGGRENARTAYQELSKVKKYYSTFKDVDAQLKIALDQGTAKVNYRMANKTQIPLPPDFEKELKKISLEELNGQWIKYHTNEIKEIQYDYSILVNLKVIDVTPEAVKEIRYIEEKEIEDGWQYVLDQKGNVMKDSLGNDMKVTKYTKVQCNVIETLQKKSARISGSLDYYNNTTKQLIKTVPITSDSFFEHAAATAIGDLRALKKETKAKIGVSPVPFPTDFGLLTQSGVTLKGMVKDIIWQNKHLLQ